MGLLLLLLLLLLLRLLRLLLCVRGATPSPPAHPPLSAPPQPPPLFRERSAIDVERRLAEAFKASFEPFDWTKALHT